MMAMNHTEYMRQYMASHPEQREKARVRQRAWRAAHREEHRAYQRQYRLDNPNQDTSWRRANPRSVRASQLRTKYGISLELYETMLAAQNGGCFFCGQPETSSRAKAPVQFLGVDHDHATGRARGLLCVGCNISLGYFERGMKSRLDPDIVASYLDEKRWW